MVEASAHLATAPVPEPRWEPLERRLHMTAAPGPASGWHVALIDASLPNATALIAAADQQKVLLFNPATESPEQVLQRVVELSRTTGRPIETISVLSHGRRGAFQLGDRLVTSDTIPQLQTQLAALAGQLAPGGRIMLFGCDTADGISGQRLIDRLASLTGATVFASTDLTGRDGDWDLEAATTPGLALPAAQLPFNVRALLASNTTLALPAGWSSQDIGSVGHAGSANHDPLTGIFTVAGSGADIWNTSDEFHFASRASTGDLDLIYRPRTIEQTDAWAKAGIMIRTTTAANSPFAIMLQRPDGLVSFQWRSAGGASAEYVSTTPAVLGSTWLRLTRVGNTLTGYYSTDGTTWTQHGTKDIVMPSSVRAGLAVTSHNNTRLCTATFESGDFTGPRFTVAPPAQASAGWNNGSATVPLSALATDPAGDAAIVYTWTRLTGPGGGTVTFSHNASNAAKNTQATFDRIGTYTLRLTARNAAGQYAVRDVVVHVGPRHWYRLDHSSGSVAVDSGFGGVNGTVSASNLWRIGGRDGRHIYTTNQQITFNVGDLQDKFTLSAWIKPDTATGTKTVYANTTSVANVNGFRFYLQQNTAGAGTLAFYTGNGTSSLTVSTAANIVPSGVWSQVVAVVDRQLGTVSLYLNGVDVTPGTNAIRTDFSSASPLRALATTNSTHRFRGGLDDLRIYDQTLTAADVLATATEGPAAPALTLTPSLTQAKLDWTPGSGTEISYEIERSSDGGNTWALLATVPADVLTFTDTTIGAAGTYDYRVRATDGSFNSPYATQGTTFAAVATTFQLAPTHAGGAICVAPGGRLRFTAVWLDQFDNPLAAQPALTWSIDPGGVGSIDASGLYTAPAANGEAVVRVTDGTVTRTINVAVRRAIIDYKDGFSSADGLQLNSSPQVIGNRLRLSDHTVNLDTGTAYSTTRADIRRFSTYFTFAYNDAAVADGLAFVIQNNALTARSGSGPNVSSVFQRSIAVRLLLHQGGSSVDRLSLGVNGAFGAATELQPRGVDLHADGHTFAAYIAYDGAELAVTITDLTAGRSVTQTYLVDIPATLNSDTAWVGFGQGMGGSHATQEILGWTVSSEHPNVTAGPVSATPTTTASSMALSATAHNDDDAPLIYTWSTVSVPAGASVGFSLNGTTAAKDTIASFNRAGVYTLRLTVSDGTYTSVRDVTFTVEQQLTSITAAPAAGSVVRHGTTALSAVGYDQFGQVMVTQPAFTWTTTRGSVSSGTFTAGADLGTASLTASSGGVQGTTSVSIVNGTPSFSLTARADQSVVIGKTVTLRALGADDAGEAALTYTWELVSGPAAVTVGVNRTNAAKITDVTFTRAGVYTFRVLARDADGASMGSTVTVTVSQTLTSMAVTPALSSVQLGQSLQLTATGRDQFGDPMTPQPTWSVATVALGTIDATGLFTGLQGGEAQVVAMAGEITAIALVTVILPPVSPPAGGGEPTNGGDPGPGAETPPSDGGLPAAPGDSGSGGSTPDVGGGGGAAGGGEGGAAPGGNDGGNATDGGQSGDGGSTDAGTTDPGAGQPPAGGGDRGAGGPGGNDTGGSGSTGGDAGGADPGSTPDHGGSGTGGQNTAGQTGGSSSNNGTGGDRPANDAPPAEATAGGIASSSSFSASTITTASDGSGEAVLATGDPTLPNVRFAEASVFATGANAAMLAPVVPDGIERVVEAQIDAAQLSSALVNPLTHQDSALAKKLDEVNEQMSAEMKQIRVAVGSASATVAASAFAYVIWILRSGLLLAGVLESLPLWNWFDPMPVLRKPEETRRPSRLWNPLRWFRRDSNVVRYTTEQKWAAQTDDKHSVKVEVDADEQRIRSLIEQTTSKPLAKALSTSTCALPDGKGGDANAHA